MSSLGTGASKQESDHETDDKTRRRNPPAIGNEVVYQEEKEHLGAVTVEKAH